MHCLPSEDSVTEMTSGTGSVVVVGTIVVGGPPGDQNLK